MSCYGYKMQWPEQDFYFAAALLESVVPHCNSLVWSNASHILYLPSNSVVRFLDLDWVCYCISEAGAVDTIINNTQHFSVALSVLQRWKRVPILQTGKRFAHHYLTNLELASASSRSQDSALTTGIGCLALHGWKDKGGLLTVFRCILLMVRLLEMDAGSHKVGWSGRFSLLSSMVWVKSKAIRSRDLEEVWSGACTVDFTLPFKANIMQCHVFIPCCTNSLLGITLDH